MKKVGKQCYTYQDKSKHEADINISSKRSVNINREKDETSTQKAVKNIEKKEKQYEK